MRYRWSMFPSQLSSCVFVPALFVSIAIAAAPVMGQPSAQADLRFDGDHAEVLLGEVSVQSLAEDRVAVTVNQLEAENSDGTAERVFILSTAEPLEVAFPMDSETAEVVVRKDRLMIMSLERPLAVGIFLSDAEPVEIQERLAANLADRYGHAVVEELSLLSGYGLADYRGSFRLPVDTWPPEQRAGNILRPKGWENVVTTKSGCRSGGVGSSACSIDCATQSGCGITCQEGYYACCNCTWGLTPGCKCISNGYCGLHPCEP